jgi:hypothetical protein
VWVVAIGKLWTLLPVFSDQISERNVHHHYYLYLAISIICLLLAIMYGAYPSRLASLPRSFSKSAYRAPWKLNCNISIGNSMVSSAIRKKHARVNFSQTIKIWRLWKTYECMFFQIARKTIILLFIKIYMKKIMWSHLESLKN